MKNRLTIARKLLKDDGLIFMSIDENECHYLKILCDQIFGRENFVIDLIRKTRTAGNQSRTNTNIQHEYCLVYAKNIDRAILVGRKKEFKNYKNPDNDPNGDWTRDNPTVKGGRNDFKIINPITNAEIPRPIGRSWMFSQDQFHEYVESRKIIFNDKGMILKRYKKDVKSQYHTVNSLDFSSSNDYTNSKATKHLNQLFKKDVFAFPKPVEFIQKIVACGSSGNDVILDFFAGSGTTGEAVLRQNKADGGQRQFILIEQLGKHIKICQQRLQKVLMEEKLDESFVSCQLAKYNQYFIENIRIAESDSELTKIWKTMRKKGFLNYRIDSSKINLEDRSLTTKDKKQILIESLDYNQIYISKSEMGDSRYKISKKQQDLNDRFYNSVVQDELV